MRAETRKLLLLLGFVAAGLISGIVAMACPMLIGAAGWLLSGAPFGLAIAGYLALTARKHSVAADVVFVGTSAVAQIAAFYSTVWIYDGTFRAPNDVPVHVAQPPAYYMFVGGLIGSDMLF